LDAVGYERRKDVQEERRKDGKRERSETTDSG
jgi:hypothetical protein